MPASRQAGGTKGGRNQPGKTGEPCRVATFASVVFPAPQRQGQVGCPVAIANAMATKN